MSRIDSHAVCTVCLAKILAPLIGPGEANRNRLAFSSGIHARRIYGIVAHEYATVGLNVADELLMALGHEYLLQSLEVFWRPRGRSMGIAGNHVCSLADRVSSARRLAAVESPLAGATPDAEAFVASQTAAEAA